MTDVHTQEIARTWEADDAACVQLIVGISRQLRQIQAGELLQVNAHSPGAPADLPSWCRVTGHSLVAAEHPVYVVKKQGPEEEGLLIQ